MPMLTTTTVDQVRQAVKQAHADGLRIGLVPTMGHLHEGHLSLIRAARLDCHYVVVSIFVNPTQFVAGDDYQTYPRTLETDLDACRSENVNLVFAPHTDQMYHQPLTTVQVAKLTETLCGAHRPGHFHGVTTVVAKLFNIVQPDAAYFGQKDAQQVVVIKKMVADLFFPVQIVVCPTIRGPDGLALSSRNDYLSDQQRNQATSLSAALQAAADQIAQGQRSATTLIELMRTQITSAGPCRVDYISIVHPETLESIDQITGPALLAAAVRIGQARLIDNILATPA